jgi:hypothetical protein
MFRRAADKWAGRKSAKGRLPPACDSCLSITATALVSDNGFAHVREVRHLEYTASDCQLCQKIYWNYLKREQAQLGNTHLRLKVKPPTTPPQMGERLFVTASSLNAAGEMEMMEMEDIFVVVPLGEVKSGLRLLI